MMGKDDASGWMFEGAHGVEGDDEYRSSCQQEVAG